MANDSAGSDMPNSATPPHQRKVPLYLRVLIGALMGLLFGWLFGTGPIVFSLTNADLGQLGVLVIRLLKALAVPLVLFAVIDAMIRTAISKKAGGRLIAICLINVSVAFTIGLLIINIFRPGDSWRGKIESLTGMVEQSESAAGAVLQRAKGATLSPIENIAGYVPESLLDPFVKNNVLTVVLFALLAGAALRRVKETSEAVGNNFHHVEAVIDVIYRALLQMLSWVIQLIPFAVFGVVAQAVGRSGFTVFQVLFTFFAAIVSGLAIHSLIYYPTIAWLIGGKSPREYIGKGADAILTGLSTNSSLATVPLTLKCLTERMGVSHGSARLSACVGTNLNNDGITLYEAMAALFLTQAAGFDLTLGQQLTVVAASLMAGVGISGIPEAGLIVLPLVLSAAGLPDAFVVAVIPLILPIDWVIGRVRSAVNVMSDMLVAILLDRFPSEPGKS